VFVARGRADHVLPECREQQRRDGERCRIGEEGSRCGRYGEEERPNRRTDHDGEILHGVKQRVGGTDSTLPHQAWEQRQRCRPLRARRCRRCRDDSDRQRNRAMASDHRRQYEHDREAQQASDHQHRAAGMAVRDGAADWPEQYVGKQAADRGRADPHG
jgi:hypothetical protein